MNDITELGKYISIAVGSLTLLTGIGALTIKFFKRIKVKCAKNAAIYQIPAQIEEIKKRLEEIAKSNAETNEAQMNRLNEIEAEVLGNERDRLKHIILEFGNRARNQEAISGENFRYLQQVFEKYTAHGGNGIARDEYELVCDYYNNQGGK